MKRLIEMGLMFGGLVPVDSPALVSRYNRALKKLAGKETALTDFHIDISGFSPEVAEEFDDWLYLNPKGVNRQFILLSTAQKDAPLLNTKFSGTRAILQRFIELNESELFALTTRDAVAGELANSVFDLSSPERLFDIRRIRVEADTTQSHVAEAKKLAEKIEKFKTDPDGWWDDVLIADMIELAKVTGDVTNNPISLQALSTEMVDFWTAHFGGLYLFRSADHPAAISVGDKTRLGQLPIAYTFDLRDRNQLARFLQLNNLAEPIVRVRGHDAARVLGQKLDFVLVDAAATHGLEIGDGSRRDLRKVAQALGNRIPDEFRALLALKRWAEGGGDWPTIRSDHPAYFYTLRATPGPNRDLVNQLLAELSPLDIRQMYLCHKELFYATYRNWPEAKRAFVAEFLAREVQKDADGARAELFGTDAPMRRNDVLDQVGPWGRVRRK